MNRALLALTALGALSLAAPASALEAEQRVLKEVVVQQANGTTSKKYVNADLVTPGETVVYALVFRNDDVKPVDDIVLVMPVPAEVRYIEGSATNRLSSVEFSADGGGSFTAREGLSKRQPDGRVTAATTDDITHVRWKVARSVQPGETGQLWFRGTLR